MNKDAQDSANPTQTENAEAPQNESLLANLMLNIVIPTLIMTKLAGEDALGAKGAIATALAFPLLYGLKDFIKSRRLNGFSALGAISILLTGGISLLELDPKYIAIKEAAIPGLIGLATLISIKTPYPLVRTFLYNPRILRVDRIDAALQQFNNRPAFERCLNNASIMLASSFFLSSVLNYGLAVYLLQSPPGTAAFTEELGRMTALSFPLIALPATLIMMASLFYLFKRIRQLTQLQLEEILVQG